jgi:hypothetical protein
MCKATEYLNTPALEVISETFQPYQTPPKTHRHHNSFYHTKHIAEYEKFSKFFVLMQKLSS